jgi:valyl-tRNA synthetase
MDKQNEMLSIKEMMERIGLDPNFIIELGYKKSQVFLMKLIVKTETTLKNIQEVDGMEVMSERQKSVQNSLNGLVFSHNKLVEMEGIIHALRKENEMLNERLNARK